MLAPMTSAFERSMAARAGSLQMGHLSPSARDEADALEAGEAGSAALPGSNSLRSLSSAESWKTALSTARCAADPSLCFLDTQWSILKYLYYTLILPRCKVCQQTQAACENLPKAYLLLDL